MACEERLFKNLSGSDVEDYRECLSVESFKNRTAVIVYLLILIIVGFLGNVLVIVVHIIGFKPCSSRVYILAMAVLDMVTSIVGIPLQIIAIRYAYNVTSLWLCQSVFIAATIPTQASGFVLVVVALDRLHRIWKPHKHHLSERQAIFVIVIVMIIITALFGPLVPMYSIIPIFSHGLELPMCWHDYKISHSAYYRAYGDILSILFFGGFVTMFIAYVLIAVKIRISGKKGSKPTEFKGQMSPKTSTVDGSTCSSQISRTTEERQLETSESLGSSDVDDIILPKRKGGCIGELALGVAGIIENYLITRAQPSPVAVRNSTDVDIFLTDKKPRAHSLSDISNYREKIFPSPEKLSKEIDECSNSSSLTNQQCFHSVKDTTQRERSLSMPSDTVDDLAKISLNFTTGDGQNLIKNVTFNSTKIAETVPQPQDDEFMELTSAETSGLPMQETDEEVSMSITSDNFRAQEQEQESRTDGEKMIQVLPMKGDDEDQTSPNRGQCTRKRVSFFRDLPLQHVISITTDTSFKRFFRKGFLERSRGSMTSITSHGNSKATSSIHSRMIKSRTTLTMIVLTICYVLNWLPHLIMRTLYRRPVNWCPELTECGFADNLYAICLRSVYLNSAVNAFVYSICSSNFRRSCHLIFSLTKTSRK